MAEKLFVTLQNTSSPNTKIWPIGQDSPTDNTQSGSGGGSTKCHRDTKITEKTKKPGSSVNTQASAFMDTYNCTKPLLLISGMTWTRGQSLKQEKKFPRLNLKNLFSQRIDSLRIICRAISRMRCRRKTMWPKGTPKIGDQVSIVKPHEQAAEIAANPWRGNSITIKAIIGPIYR